jgi:hypothetical protein
MCSSTPAQTDGALASPAASASAWSHPKADPAGWQPVPLVSPANREAGVTYGGEGGQWIQSLAIDRHDGQFLIYGIDVAGMLRSLDGGKTWEPSNVGFTPRGASGAAIDPNFPRRAIVIGSNSMPSGRHGVYLSEDQAASWEHVLPIEMCGLRDIRDQVAFDPATRDDELGVTRDVYWSRLAIEKPGYGSIEPDPAIYRSGDGGRTWSRLPDTAHVAGGVLRADPHGSGRLITHGLEGLYVSDDRAATWRKIKDGMFTGLDFSHTRPGEVWLTDAQTLYRSNDHGETFTPVVAAGEALAREEYTLRGVEVSPADPDRLILWRQENGGWDWSWHVSHDAGATWSRSRHDNAKAFLPQNERQGVFAWHPTDADVIVSTGGDWPTRSTDGGRSFAWSATGFVGNLVSSQFHFNPNQPDLLFLGSQDYSAALTQDGGHTWRYVNVSGKSWGGFTYAAHAVSPDVLIAGDAKSWGAARRLNISRDGGKTWERRHDVVFDRRNWDKPDAEIPYGHQSAFACPDRPDVWFFGPWRSADAGRTWSVMENCDGIRNLAVSTDDQDPRTLVGTDYDPHSGEAHVVLSDDHGDTWRRVLSAKGRPGDAAYNADDRIAYLTAGGNLFRAQIDEPQNVEQLDPPRDQFGNRRVHSVALDPQRPSILYAAQNRDIYTMNASALRSLDGATPGTCSPGRPRCPRPASTAAANRSSSGSTPSPATPGSAPAATGPGAIRRRGTDRISPAVGLQFATSRRRSLARSLDREACVSIDDRGFRLTRLSDREAPIGSVASDSALARDGR